MGRVACLLFSIFGFSACLNEVIYIFSESSVTPAVEESLRNISGSICYKGDSGPCADNVPGGSCGDVGCNTIFGGLWVCNEPEDPQVFPTPETPYEINTSYQYEITTATLARCEKSSTGWTDQHEDQVATPCQVVYSCNCDGGPNNGGCSKGAFVYNSFDDRFQCTAGGDPCGFE